MKTISDRLIENNPRDLIRVARRYHRYECRRNPQLAPAVAGSGYVMPGGEVVLALVGGGVISYYVAVAVGYRVIGSARGSHRNVIDKALDQLVALDRHHRAAHPETVIPIAA